jgi:hypothetical protein
MRRTLGIAGLCLVAAGLVAGSARADGTLGFTIFKEGDPIGHDSYTIEKAGDLTKVKVETQTDVHVLFISYHYRQDRTEIWKDGALQSLVSDTDDDGTKHHVDVHREGDALVASADGAKKTAPGTAVPFTLWTNEFLKAPVVLDVTDFQQMKVGVEDKGSESLAIDGKTVPAHRFHLTGDLSWDLWYGSDGILLKTAFKRRGYPIFLVRQ